MEQLEKRVDAAEQQIKELCEDLNPQVARHVDPRAEAAHRARHRRRHLLAAAGHRPGPGHRSSHHEPINKPCC